MSAFGFRITATGKRNISRHRTPTEIRQFFIMKARRSESKASIDFDYLCGPGIQAY